MSGLRLLRSRVVHALLLASTGLLASGCAWLTPKQAALTPTQLLDRFPAQVPWPVEQPVDIHWQENLIPFVEAQTDADCAFAIGVVHAFLRLGQMEIFRRGSAGRLAESLGPVVAPDIDALLRKLDLDRTASQSEALMSPADRLWLTRYLEGINFFIANTPELPPEFALLALQPEPWTTSDSLRIGKLGSADPNWATLLGLLRLRDKPGWQQVWQRVLTGASQSMPTIPAASAYASPGLVGLQQWLSLGARSGSNSIVVGGSRSASGAALIASDPHLGIFVPNLWVLMGYRSPSYQVVGYMLPGVPAVTLGRNPEIAWGGTAMRGISSHLFEVADDQIIGTRRETIRVRGWFDRTVEIAESRSGPVVFEGWHPVSGQPQKVALSWTGHQPGDDLGAFLAANRARDWTGFRAAFERISGPSLNLTYADAKGHIGFLPAIRQPLLQKQEQQNDLIKTSDNAIAGYRSPSQLPSLADPPEGFIASANNLPVQTEPRLALPSAENGRKQRLDALASATNRAGVEQLMTWQQDVYSADALLLRDLILKKLGSATADAEALDRLRRWDGLYTVMSAGAVAHEVIIWRLAQQMAERLPLAPKLRKRWLSFDDWRLALKDSLDAMPDIDAQRLIVEAIELARQEIDEYQTWGEWHQQPLQSPLGLLPVLGRRFRYGEFPAPGGSATVHKAGFASGEGPRPVIFGAQVRHISDLANVDENYFVMLGGNAGWLDNEALVDQVALWRQGRYLRIPLSAKGVGQTFTLRTHKVGANSSP